MNGLDSLRKLQKYINCVYGINIIEQYKEADKLSKIIETELKLFELLKPHIKLYSIPDKDEYYFLVRYSTKKDSPDDFEYPIDKETYDLWAEVIK